MFKEENFGQINHAVDKEQPASRIEVTLKEHNDRQIDLIVDYFKFITGHTVNMKDKNERDDAVEYFAEKGFFKVYDDLLKSDIFKTHKDIRGNLSNITVQHLIEFQENGTLRE